MYVTGKTFQQYSTCRKYSLGWELLLKSFFPLIRGTCNTIDNVYLANRGHAYNSSKLIKPHVQFDGMGDRRTLATALATTSKAHTLTETCERIQAGIHKWRENASKNAEMIIHVSFSHSQPWTFIGTESMSVVGDKLWTRTNARTPHTHTNTHTHTHTHTHKHHTHCIWLRT